MTPQTEAGRIILARDPQRRILGSDIVTIEAEAARAALAALRVDWEETAQRAWVARDTDHDDWDAFMAGYRVALGIETP